MTIGLSPFDFAQGGLSNVEGRTSGRSSAIGLAVVARDRTFGLGGSEMDDQYKTQDVSGVDNPDVGHEKRDVNVRIVIGFGAALVIAAIIIHFLVWVVFDFYGNLNTSPYPRQFPLAQSAELKLPPSPRLQDKPREDLKELRHHEDDLLNGYTWINQQTGAVRIPIDEAMKKVMEQGFPVAPPPSPSGAGDTGAKTAPEGMPTVSSSGRTDEPVVKR